MDSELRFASAILILWDGVSQYKVETEFGFVKHIGTIYVWVGVDSSKSVKGVSQSYSSKRIEIFPNGDISG